MSQRVEVTATCSKCGKQYQSTLYRTLWGERENLRNSVMNNQVNICTCPQCGFSFHAPLAMLYVDADKKFAVWWEPEYDSEIDEITQGFTRMLGPGNYYENAPRITDWEEFKITIRKYYNGELKGQSDQVTRAQNATFSKMANNLSKSLDSKKNSGCMLTFVLFIVVGILALL